MSELNNIRISGSGSIEGGTYNDIVISGSGKIKDSIIANEVKISGSVSVDGNIKAKSIKVSGSCRISGNIKTDSISISGSGKIEGSVDASQLKVSGSVKIEGDVNVDILEGQVGSSKFNNIYGDQITIKAPRVDFNCTEINEIEATQIILESVRANRISGAIIKIDSYCEIDTIEYSESLTIGRGAQIKNIIKN